MTTYGLALLVGLIVLLVWRYLQKGLDRLDPWVVAVLPRAVAHAWTVARPRPGEIGEFVGFALATSGYVAFLLATSRWSDSWWIVMAMASWVVGGVIHRRSNTALFVVIVATCVGLAAYNGVREGPRENFIAFLAMAFGVTAIFAATSALRMWRQKRAATSA